MVLLSLPSCKETVFAVVPSSLAEIEVPEIYLIKKHYCANLPPTFGLLIYSYNIYPDVYHAYLGFTSTFIFCQKHALDRRYVSCYIDFEFFNTKIRDFWLYINGKLGSFCGGKRTFFDGSCFYFRTWMVNTVFWEVNFLYILSCKIFW